MATYTDFKNGLQDANDYLDARHHLSGTTALGNSALNVVAQAEYSFTLRELLCGILSGNGIKLPNLQICLSANIAALLGLPNLQAELRDALTQLEGAMNDFMDHTKLDSILGRLNGVLAEAQNVANMINFCSAPVDPIAIPNMIERAMGSFLGAGKNLIDQIGTIAPDNVCACIGTGGFNSNVFNGGILGQIANNIDAINAGSLGQSVIDSIRSDIEGVANGISNLISFENNINGAYALGGSQFATPDSGCNSQVGVMHNPFNGSIAENARLTSSMKALYDRLSGYPVTYRPGTTLGGTTGDTPNSSADSSVGDTTPIEYKNIFELLFDQELIDLLEQMDDPQSTVDTQTPVMDYCGNIIGYTTNYVQHEQQTSDGTNPTVPNSPGYAAGGLQTTNSTTENTSTVASGTINTVSGGGANVYLVNSEAAQLALTPNTNDIVVRTDILTIFVRLDTSAYNFGTMQDYQQSSVTFTAFGQNVNELTGSGFVTKDGSVAVARYIQGTANQINVTNGSGAGGNPTISIASDPILPGQGSVKLPAGSTSQRTASAQGGMLRYNTSRNEVEIYYADTNTWRDLATVDDITAQSNTFINIGNGAEVYKQKNASNQQEFRKINGNGAITVLQNQTDITITDALSASNIGAGVELFSSRVANDFQFKTLTSTNNVVTVTAEANTVDLDLPGLRKTTLQTTDASTVNVTFNSNILQPASGKTWFYELYVLAGDTATTRRAWKLQGVVQNNAGTASLVGAVNRTDYQRGTQDVLETPWAGGTGYNVSDTVEYDLIVYTAVNTISAGSSSSYTAPDSNSDWQATYTGWNASTEINGSDFLIKVRGDSNTVNWSIKLEYVEL